MVTRKMAGIAARSAKREAVMFADDGQTDGAGAKHATLMLPMAAPPELTEQSTASSRMAAEVKLLRITSHGDVAHADKLLQELARAKKHLAEIRNYLVRPLKDHVKRLEQLVKPVLDVVEAADTELRQKVLAYRREDEAKRASEQARLMKEVAKAERKGDVDAALDLATRAVELDKDAGVGPATQVRPKWTFEVVDLGAVPHEYFSLDEKKVNAAIRAGARTIKGLRIFEGESLAVYGEGRAR